MATCRCGRPISVVPHCFFCGSLNVYARARGDDVVISEGKTIISRGFRCRRCGLAFNEHEDCEAPPMIQPRFEEISKSTAVRAIEKAVDGTRNKEIILREALKMLREKKAEEDKKKADEKPDDDFDPKKLQ